MEFDFNINAFLKEEVTIITAASLRMSKRCVEAGDFLENILMMDMVLQHSLMFA